MPYTVKSLRQIDGNHTGLLLFVKGASLNIRQLDNAVAHECPLGKPDVLHESVDTKEAYRSEK